jgi:hypothetical protein
MFIAAGMPGHVLLRRVGIPVDIAFAYAFTAFPFYAGHLAWEFLIALETVLSDID